MKKRKSDIASKKTGIEKLNFIGRMTSGTCAAAGIYYLSSDIQENVKNNNCKKDIHKKEVKNRVSERHNKTVDKYNEVKSKITMNSDTKLTCDEMRSILRHHIRKNDSPLRSKVNELRQQWETRKHCLVTEAPPFMMKVDVIDATIPTIDEICEMDDIESVASCTEDDVEISCEI